MTQGNLDVLLHALCNYVHNSVAVFHWYFQLTFNSMSADRSFQKLRKMNFIHECVFDQDWRAIPFHLPVCPPEP